MQTPTRRVSVENASDTDGISTALVRKAVNIVLDGEGVGDAEFCVTLFTGQRMRWLNRNTFGKDRATDVVAFSLPHHGTTVGDVYICPTFARRAARQLQISEKEELVRLLVHGTLHVLGYDHPSGEDRFDSEMWRRQEIYVGKTLRGRK